MEAIRRNGSLGVLVWLVAFLIGGIAGYLFSQSLFTAFCLAWLTSLITVLVIAFTEPKWEHDDSVNGEHPTN